MTNIPDLKYMKFTNMVTNDLNEVVLVYSIPAKVVAKRHRFAVTRGEEELKASSELHLVLQEITGEKRVVIAGAPLLRPGSGGAGSIVVTG